MLQGTSQTAFFPEIFRGFYLGHLRKVTREFPKSRMARQAPHIPHFSKIKHTNKTLEKSFRNCTQKLHNEIFGKLIVYLWSYGPFSPLLCLPRFAPSLQPAPQRSTVRMLSSCAEQVTSSLIILSELHRDQDQIMSRRLPFCPLPTSFPVKF